jgi:DNA-directed RNA polymerase specialized sigma24 family protein
MHDADKASFGPTDSGGTEGQSGEFTTTHWSVVARAGDSDLAGSAAAKDQLCRTYQHPIYAFIRRTRGVSREDAEDLRQGFFKHIVEREALKKARQEKGKFRTFLLAVLQKFLANEWDKAQTWKRGGRNETVSLDEMMAEEGSANEPADSLTPEKLFVRHWAAALLNRVLGRLEQDYVETGKGKLFAKLAPGIVEVDDGFYAQCATELGTTVGNAKVAMHRLRGRYRELLRSEVAQTVSSAEDVEEEIRYLLAALGE